VSKIPPPPIRNALIALVLALLVAAGMSTTATSAAKPVIDSFSPTSGPVGTVVSILGTDLGETTQVAFHGNVPAAFSVVSDGELTAAVPPGAVTGRIKVTTLSGTAASGASFQVTYPVPVVTSVSPLTGPVGGVVTISGIDLAGATAVTFSAGVSAAFEVVSNGQLTAIVPPSAVSGRIRVITPGGIGASGTRFRVALPPSIVSVSPSTGMVGTRVEVFGGNLRGALQVRFGVTNASFTVVSDTQVVTTVPAGATSSYLTVATPGGLATNPSVFAVVHLRTVSFHRPSPLVVTGRVTVIDGFTMCEQGAGLEIQRNVSGHWRLIARGETNRDGSYRSRLPVATGPFRIKVARSISPTGDVCALAISGHGPHPGSPPPVPPPSPPPSSRMIWGIFSSPRDGRSPQQVIRQLELEIGRNFGGERIYTGMDSNLPTELDRELASKGQVIYHNFSSWIHRGSRKVCIPWADIASGTQDAWLITQARNIRAWGYPIFLTFTHEPTIDNPVHPQCGSPEEYRAAFDHVVHVFDMQGATNATWVWTLTAATFSGASGGPTAWEPSHYDVVGVDGYNHARRWRSPDEIFQSAQDFAALRNKPLLVGEIGCEELPGDPNGKADWIAQAAALFRSWHDVRAIMWTNSGGGGFFWLDSSPQALAAFAAARREASVA
jgi:hypothetical protein